MQIMVIVHSNIFQGSGIGGYIHQQLSNANNIRLFYLLPGQGFDPLQGSLRENRAVGGGYEDPFEAISYTWGEARFTSVMELDGSMIQITKSLEAALIHVRSPRLMKYIWVDQICINQSDLQERSDQVRQMYNIYAKAERVHVWLGPSNESSGIGMMFLQQLCHPEQNNGEFAWKNLPPDMIRAGIEDIARRPWFHRIWVVQEAAVAKGIVMSCGGHQISWTNTTDQVRFFSRALKTAILSPAWTQTDLKEVDMEPFLQVLQRQLENGPTSSEYKANLPPLDLLDIAYEMRGRVSTDPRDRIFAMLGFADEETRQKLAPDYTLSLEKLHQRFEEVLLHGRSGLNQRETQDRPAQTNKTAPGAIVKNPRDLEECWDVVNQHDEVLDADDLFSRFFGAA